jgi:hypothetical protein
MIQNKNVELKTQLKALFRTKVEKAKPFGFRLESAVRKASDPKQSLLAV